MTYQEFTQEVLELLSNQLPESANISIRKTMKNNDTELDAIVIQEEGINISPTIYVSMFFEQHRNGTSVEECARQIYEVYQEYRIDESIDISFYTDFEKVKPRICFRLINREMNKELLNDVPYIPILDLALVFTCLVESCQEGNACILIKNEHLSKWDKSREEIYELAKINTPRLMEFSLISMKEFMLDRLPDCVEMADLAGQLPQMYILTNHSKSYGAGVILYQGMLKSIADILEADLYIIPSSVHETLLVPVNDLYDPEELNTFIKEVNATELPQQDVLSDHYYYYSRDKDQIVCK